MSYPLDYYNALAAWCTLTIGLALPMSAHLERRAARAAALAVVPLAGVVLFLTYSRAGLIGAAVAIVLAVLVVRHRWTAAAHAVGAVAVTAPVVALAHHHRSIADGSGADGAAIVAAGLVLAMAGCAALAMGPWTRGLDGVRVRSRLAHAIATVAVSALVAVTIVSVAGRAWSSFTAAPPPTPQDPVQRLGDLGGNRDGIWTSALDAFQAHPVHGTGAGTFESGSTAMAASPR